jgi:pimeloyl-ACP methyl ester carboxylesterase
MNDLSILDLADGRRLELYVSGPDGAVPVVFHHGTPGSALPDRFMERAIHARGLRLVSASRPGYGRSTPQPGRRVVDVVDDTSAVLDHLGIERCLVAGWSGGGPHALACAARLDRAVAALVIAGVAPFEADGLDWLDGMGQDNLDEFGVTLEGEEALRSYLVEQQEAMVDLTAEGMVASLESILPDVDKAVITGEFGEDLMTGFTQALLEGVEGWLGDDLAFAAPWGFALSEITIPTMLWQGSEDLMVPFAHGRWLASQLPRATAHLEQDEGHLSIGIGAVDRMLDELAATLDG